jgi:L-cysteine/cystine lyase
LNVRRDTTSIISVLALEVTSRGAAGSLITVDDSLVLGRDADGAGRLAGDQDVSRGHARVTRTPDGGLRIEDLDSTNGTFVNGGRVHERALAAGDTIQLGSTTLTVVSPGLHRSESGMHDALTLAGVTGRRAARAPATGDAATFRAQFPVFERVSYLNAGTDGPVPRQALDAAGAATRVVLEEGRSGHAHWDQLAAMGAEMRQRYASLLGCEPDEVALTRSTADGINTVVSGLGLGSSDEVLTTDEEHQSLLGPIAAAVRRTGASVRVVPFAQVANEIGPRTRLVACSHVSWVTGSVVDTRALAQADVPLLLDGAQALGAIPVDLRALGCDYYAAAGQKWLCGPDGSGVLYIRSDRLPSLLPPWVSFFSLSDPSRPLELPFHGGAARFDMGNVIGTLAVWVLSSLDVLEDAGWDWVLERGPRLADGFAGRLRERGIDVAPRGASTLVSWRAQDAEQRVEQLSDQGFIVRDLPGLGLIRASIGAWSTEAELERLAALAL